MNSTDEIKFPEQKPPEPKTTERPAVGFDTPTKPVLSAAHVLQGVKEELRAREKQGTFQSTDTPGGSFGGVILIRDFLEVFNEWEQKIGLA